MLLWTQFNLGLVESSPCLDGVTCGDVSRTPPKSLGDGFCLTCPPRGPTCSSPRGHLRLEAYSTFCACLLCRAKVFRELLFGQPVMHGHDEKLGSVLLWALLLLHTRRGSFLATRLLLITYTDMFPTPWGSSSLASAPHLLHMCSQPHHQLLPTLLPGCPEWCPGVNLLQNIECYVAPTALAFCTDPCHLGIASSIPLSCIFLMHQSGPLISSQSFYRL
uniref:Uncharacterized protein n=1 Tax=Eutreptiella gymnastica TaxID=73025 RepID=A0A7S1HT24_9EUGL|mmetsp:Transcript_103711/g.178626  ORF Transcript_103711/g.178626 Transcript_103711/m.178626 type:complete len:219 (+) Transcript_103711:1365-2021(+)